jgi:DNA transformation protein
VGQASAKRSRFFGVAPAPSPRIIDRRGARLSRPADDGELCAQVLGHLAGMDRVSSRPMFGGIGLYCGARLFGIVFKGDVYMRADEGMRRGLARSGGGAAFRPYRGKIVNAYWALPEALLSDKRRMRAWARRAIAASEAAARKSLARPPARRVPKKLKLGPRRPGR